MTRKQLRSLLESFQIDPSFVIVVSDVDQASIQCHNQKLKKETIQKLKEHHFNLMYHNNDCMNQYEYSLVIDFSIPKQYHIEKEKTWEQILGDMENAQSISKLF